MIRRWHFFFIVAATAVCIFSLAVATSQTKAQRSDSRFEPVDGGAAPVDEPRDEITDEQRKLIADEIGRNVLKLRAEGKIQPSSPEVTHFSWPVRKALGAPGFEVDAISNYVDQAPAGQLLDWNCGNRTYDGHRGIDIYLWPFSWNLMDNDGVEVVAGAPGTIVARFDGSFDRSCVMGGGMWNAVYVRHADGSIAWYGHLKNGSVTSKGVGQTVETGEKLGIIGSSGNSTGPHLHFELHTETNQLRDPFQGACNTLNAESWWGQQPSNRVSRVNRLMTHSAPPTFNTCPQQATTNEKNFFRPGDTFRTYAYYRDQIQGHLTGYSILRPDGSTFSSWQHNSPNTYQSSYWGWQISLPANAPDGKWTFRAVYQGVTYDHSFTVSSTATISGQVLDASGRGLRGATVSITGPDGSRRSVLSSSAGYYSFDGVKIGANYKVDVRSKQFRFTGKDIALTDDLSDVNFTGIE